MDKTEVLKTLVCKQHCRYYKPGRNEELACRGFVVVQRLLDSGRELPQNPAASVPVSASAYTNALRERLCTRCPFFAGDCDFILTAGAAAPCGGFVYLVQAFEAGVLALDELTA